MCIIHPDSEILTTYLGYLSSSNLLTFLFFDRSDILHNVGKESHYTQSGCKVFHYTTFGMRHVILAVIISLLTYAWIITRHNFNQEQLDKRIRDNIAWLIIIAFVIEAIFGITVAVYVDVSPIHATVSTI